MCAFTGVLIPEDFGDLQSGLVANVMHNPWYSSDATNIEKRVGLLCKAYTRTLVKMPQMSHMFSLSITLSCKHLPWKIIMQ